MTIIDELLILLDDLGDASPEQIPPYFEGLNLQVIFSSLGRLVNRGWVSKKIKRNETGYTITLHGVNELNQTLDAIKESEIQQWNKSWHLVIFDIPETKRKLRDNFRNLLKEIGYGMLTSSVWISPWDKGELIKRYAKRYNLGENIFQMQTIDGQESYNATILAHRCWNWSKIEDSYKEFIQRAAKALRQLKEGDNQSRFEAKRLVFLYAEAVKHDPQLPADIAPNATLVRRAHELYIKIRPFCLK